MATENKQLMLQAREALTGKWGMGITVTLIYLVVSVIVQIISRFFPPGIVLSLLITGPLAVGFSIFSLSIARNSEARVNQVFDGFNRFGTSLGAYFLMILFIILWSLLFVIPGIIAAMSYAMVFYVIADDDSITAMEALKKSKQLMNGYKWKLFFMGLRFFGWALLCVLTFGIGFLWLYPYMMVSFAKFYDDIKGNTKSTLGSGSDMPLDAKMD